jgi:TatD DNase family protein
MIIDTHAHILDAKFDTDREAVIQRAFDAGVSTVFEIACETKEWNAALEFSKKDYVYASYGVHPLEAENYTGKDLDKLETFLQDKKCFAAGEIGLDYHYDGGAKKELQKSLFIKQLDIAARLNKPVVIHCRKAYEDMAEILKNYAGLKGVIHCFLGNAAQAEEFLSMGFLLGIDGPVTYPKSDELRKAILETDISKILIETDCPYLPPQKYRGQRNEPGFITETLKAVAEIKRLSCEETADITSQNAKRLFLENI